MRYGYPEEFLHDFVNALRLIGYDGVLGIEHEASLMNPQEELNKAVQLLTNHSSFAKNPAKSTGHERKNEKLEPIYSLY